MKKFYSNYRSGSIRIIAGQWRRHKLPVLNSYGLHPTTDRMRETLFNWLNPMIKNANCLDCFTGSGSLGFEALSRYANFVTMLEIKNYLVKQLEMNLKRFKSNNGKIIHTDTLFWLENNKGKPFNIIFIDPPFNSNLLDKTIFLLEKKQWISNNSFVYIEKKSTNIINYIPNNWTLYHKKTAGKVTYSLFMVKNNLIK
ncbi:16S rRNA (guanine(966)-N(2))-methyltransferase RsmD [Candidatus Pantoea edessiphila]|uniref:Ribosomal RNA small subunit methyltransferase D n=1 Tax=Candidatus Pantoea edessiphila TaxID=2044610 RepID=A0A2P5T1Q0_9GAMM|nr:16S rRNA (guanine(966)-N(2))-methyltransferase RsmD [Candidatus Pantoea edessiphila]PPI88524.1 16S rRNA (guanine(966)-N(2))-methyltransferase RsmD [Candidatus Pantoea edessiphila]